jgi:pentatricopeptide repeat protein
MKLPGPHSTRRLLRAIIERERRRYARARRQLLDAYVRAQDYGEARHLLELIMRNG